MSGPRKHTRNTSTKRTTHSRTHTTRPRYDPEIAAEKKKNVERFYQALHLAGSYPAPKLALGPRKPDEFAPSLLIKSLPPSKPTIQVIDQNCLTTMQQAVAASSAETCLGLNMASFSHPGGGVKNGARAQEETLCRTSNLYPALAQAAKDDHYPLIQGFRHQGVTFFRDGAYQDLVEPFQVDILTISALRLPFGTTELDAGQKTTIRGRIRQLLELCVGYETVILSAFGCGAFQNPPEFVAQCFKEFLVEGSEFDGQIGHVIFAIIDDHNSQGNLQTFQQILGSHDEDRDEDDDD